MTMLKANELRFGNLLLIKGNTIEECNGDYGKLIEPHYVRVLEIYERGVSVCDLEETSDEIELFTDRIRPIPLAEEILLKCGFKRGGYDGIFLSNGKFEFSGLNDGYYGIRINNEYDIELKYLHDLQNLYFALTKEELKINL